MASAPHPPTDTHGALDFPGIVLAPFRARWNGKHRGSLAGTWGTVGVCAVLPHRRSPAFWDLRGHFPVALKFALSSSSFRGCLSHLKYTRFSLNIIHIYSFTTEVTFNNLISGNSLF